MNLVQQKLLIVKSDRVTRRSSGGAQTAGQARAAKELEKIKREQTRTADCDVGASATITPSGSRRHSNASTVNAGSEVRNQ